MMKRDDCLKALAPHIENDIVVATYMTAFDWLALRPDRALTYTSLGAMGLASSHGLGFAIGSPDRRVIVFDGDGSLLMNLGSLVTIAAEAPPNLVHFVSENGNYEANGGHPIPGRDKLSFAGAARAAGYRGVYEFSDLATLERDIPGILEQRGPLFIVLKVKAGAPSPIDYGLLYSAEARERFRKAVNEPSRSRG